MRVTILRILPFLPLAAGAMCAAELEHGALDVVHLRPSFHLIAGAGGNIGVQVGSDGVLLVDSGSAAASEQVIAAVKSITDRPIRMIINTNAEPDHVGGNAKVSKSGFTIFINPMGDPESLKVMTNGGAAAILAHNSILQRMSAPTGKTAAYPVESWPTEAYFQNRKAIRMNDEGIEIIYQPEAHGGADSVVLFRASDVVMAGDVLDTTRFPVIDLADGGSIQGEITALNHLIDLAIPPIPFIYKGVGTYVIPGHGRVCEQQDVVDYRDMVVVVRDVVADLIKQGKSLEEIKQARPALPYERRYGATSGPWTTDMFVEAIYKTLTAKK